MGPGAEERVTVRPAAEAQDWLLGGGSSLWVQRVFFRAGHAQGASHPCWGSRVTGAGAGRGRQGGEHQGLEMGGIGGSAPGHFHLTASQHHPSVQNDRENHISQPASMQAAAKCMQRRPHLRPLAAAICAALASASQASCSALLASCSAFTVAASALRHSSVVSCSSHGQAQEQNKSEWNPCRGLGATECRGESGSDGCRPRLAPQLRKDGQVLAPGGCPLMLALPNLWHSQPWPSCFCSSCCFHLASEAASATHLGGSAHGAGRLLGRAMGRGGGPSHLNPLLGLLLDGGLLGRRGASWGGASWGGAGGRAAGLTGAKHPADLVLCQKPQSRRWVQAWGWSVVAEVYRMLEGCCAGAQALPGQLLASPRRPGRLRPRVAALRPVTRASYLDGAQEPLVLLLRDVSAVASHVPGRHSL